MTAATAVGGRKSNHGRVMEAQVCFDMDAGTEKARHIERDRESKRGRQRERERARCTHSYTYEHTHTNICNIKMRVTVIANAMPLWP